MGIVYGMWLSVEFANSYISIGHHQRHWDFFLPYFFSQSLSSGCECYLSRLESTFEFTSSFGYFCVYSMLNEKIQWKVQVFICIKPDFPLKIGNYIIFIKFFQHVRKHKTKSRKYILVVSLILYRIATFKWQIAKSWISTKMNEWIFYWQCH